MKEPLYVTIRRADGTVEEGVMVGEVRREGGCLTHELDGAITLQSGDSVTIDGFTLQSGDSVTIDGFHERRAQ